jgi:hypothetical protein
VDNTTQEPSSKLDATPLEACAGHSRITLTLVTVAGQNVQREAAHELLGFERHRLVPRKSRQQSFDEGNGNLPPWESRVVKLAVRRGFQV